MLAAILFLCFSVCLSAYSRDDGFFSFQRLSLKTALTDNIPEGGMTEKDLKAFCELFTRALDEALSGNSAEAEIHLHAARELWPEFFGTDLALAFLYEKNGDNRTAARYYKSYLNKLKDYHDGRYTISAPLIRSVSSYDIEKYDLAYSLVVERLAGYGISLERVHPAVTVPALALPLAIGGGIALVYIAVCCWLWPLVRKRYKITHPPRGFWVCGHCAAENPDPNKVCQECRRPRNT